MTNNQILREQAQIKGQNFEEAEQTEWTLIAFSMQTKTWSRV